MFHRVHKSYLLSFLAGALFSQAFAPLYLWPFTFISLTAFYVMLTRAESCKQALWRGFLFGYGFFMAGTWWIGNALLVDAAKFGWMMPFSILGLSAVMALWLLPFSYCIWRGRAVMNPAVFAVTWVLFEWLRSLGVFGFPWNLAGYISLASLELTQVASIVGIYGLSLVVVWFSTFPIYWIEKKPRRVLSSVAAVFFLLSIGWWGSARLAEPTQFGQTRIRLVQPNIPQVVKGTREGSELAAQLLGGLSKRKHDASPADLTIWPETAYPFAIRSDQAVLVPEFDGILLTGAVRAEGQKPEIHLWNSLVALSAAGEVLASYDKHQLVPFGEFVPLRHLLPLDKITPGDTDFSRGTGPVTIHLAHLPSFSPQICYEGIFPSLAVNRSDLPEWMLNVTNDAWYGDTAGPYQHLDMVRMRAIEHGIPMVRVANSGISAVIDGNGRIVQQLGLNERGVIETALPVAISSPSWF